MLYLSPDWPTQVGPAGWHLHSFASTAHAMYKFFTRAGKHVASFDQHMLDTVKSKRTQCDEVHTVPQGGAIYSLSPSAIGARYGYIRATLPRLVHAM
eukprot:817849-Prorocentrum_minimum.AAC.1